MQVLKIKRYSTNNQGHASARRGRAASGKRLYYIVCMSGYDICALRCSIDRTSAHRAGRLAMATVMGSSTSTDAEPVMHACIAAAPCPL